MTILFSILFSSVAFADPITVTVRSGQPAPFEGTLLNAEAVAQIIARSESDLKECEVNKDLQLSIQSAKFESERSILGTRVTSCESALSDLQDENKKIIKKYDRLSSSIPYVAGIGLLGGIGLTVLTIQAVSWAN